MISPPRHLIHTITQNEISLGNIFFLSVLYFDTWLEVFKENTKSNELEFRDFCDQKSLSDQEWQYKSYLNTYTECTLQAHGRI